MSVEHTPRSTRKREKACSCGATFRSPQKLRRHLREENRTGPMTLWLDAIQAAQFRREAR